MTRSRILAALVGLGILATPGAAALAQTHPTVIVPAPGASPSTIVTPTTPGTTVVAPPGSTVVVHPPAPTATAVVPVTPWCGGAYASPGGTNFAGCGAAWPR